MGVSTDGQLSFGIAFDEGFEFPWDDEKYGGDIEDWWRDVRGFVNPVECPYDEDGNYRPGISGESPVIGEYYDARRKWDSENPIPVQLVNYCSGDYPMYIIAVKHMDCVRGYPKVVDPEFMATTAEDEKKLLDFMTEFGIESEDKPAWLLSSYWG